MVDVLAAAAWRFHWNAGVSMFVYFLFGGFAFRAFPWVPLMHLGHQPAGGIRVPALQHITLKCFSFCVPRFLGSYANKSMGVLVRRIPNIFPWVQVRD